MSTPCISRSLPRLLAGLALLAALAPRLSAQGANDCAAAQAIFGPGTVPVDTSSSTNDGTSTCDATGDDVWFAYTASIGGLAVVSTCGIAVGDSVITIKAGGCFGVEIACNDDACGPQSTVTIQISASSTYLIRVSDKGGVPVVGGLGILEDVDTDGDFVPDALDGCPEDAAKVAPGLCGCGQPETAGCGVTFPLVCGELVTTYFPAIIPNPQVPATWYPDPAGYCVKAVDPRNCSANGSNCFAPLYSNQFSTANHVWNYANLGSVFAIALDGEPQPNVYVAASTAFGNWPFGPGGPGAVYKIDGQTGNISHWLTTAAHDANVLGTSTLPNSGVGLGDIAFDRYHRPEGKSQFFVSNMEDGRIYRVLDDGATGRVVQVIDPHAPSAGGAGFEPLGERIWGLTVINARTLVYSGWLRDRGTHALDPRRTTPWPTAWGTAPAEPNNALFIALLAPHRDFGGQVTSTPPNAWRVMPRLPGESFSNPVSDIAFVGSTSSLYATDKVLVGERAMRGDFGLLQEGHDARVIEFVAPTLNHTGESYRIGAYGSKYNSAGGVAYEDDEDVWASGDNLRNDTPPDPLVYGLQRVVAGGNPGTGSAIAQSPLIDLDHETQTGDKSQPGDVEFACTVGVADPGNVTFCWGDPAFTPCPCGNTGLLFHGCSSSLFANGASLQPAGLPSVSADTLTLNVTSVPNSSCLFFQGTAQGTNGLGTPFGDGLRCATGSVLRLGTKTAVANTASYPVSGDAPISVRGAIPLTGAVRTYQVWYRNSAAFCTVGTFNLSNGIELTWIP